MRRSLAHLRRFGDAAFAAAKAAGRALSFEQALLELERWLGREAQRMRLSLSSKVAA